MQGLYHKGYRLVEHAWNCLQKQPLIKKEKAFLVNNRHGMNPNETLLILF